MTSGGRSMWSAAMRPSSGTGHSTRPATSSSSPGSSTTVSWRSAARRGDAVGDDALALAASTSTRWARSLSAQSAQAVTAKAPGAWKRWPSVRLADGQAVPVVVAVAQVERHDRAIQQAGDAAQRAHPGEVAAAAPAHRLRPGEAAQQRRECRRRSARRRAPRRPPCPAPSSRLPARSCSRVAPCLRRKPASACSGALARGPRSVVLAGGDLGVPPRRPGQCGAGRRTCARGGRQRGQGLGGQPREVLRRARLHARRDFLTEQLEKELRHDQSFSAGSMSVWEKSLPLNSSGSRSALATP